jgi:hypothetical protein
LATRSRESTEGYPTTQQYPGFHANFVSYPSLEGRNGFDFNSSIAAVFSLYLQQTGSPTGIPLVGLEGLTDSSEPVGQTAMLREIRAYRAKHGL